MHVLISQSSNSVGTCKNNRDVSFSGVICLNLTRCTRDEEYADNSVPTTKIIINYLHCMHSFSVELTAADRPPYYASHSATDVQGTIVGLGASLKLKWQRNRLFMSAVPADLNSSGI